MYARVTTTQARMTKNLDEQRRLIENELLPLMQQQPGFRGYLGLVDPTTGKMVGISLWDSEGDNFDFGSQRMVQEINGKFQPLVDHPKLLKVVALSGGFSRAEACAELARNPGMIASFSRALLSELRAQQSDEEFDRTLGSAIDEIYQASTEKLPA